MEIKKYYYSYLLNKNEIIEPNLPILPDSLIKVGECIA